MSCINACWKSRQDAKSEEALKGLEVSQYFEKAQELEGEEPLRAKDAEYTVGPWRSSVGVFELKVVVAGGRRTDEFLTLNGKRLKENTEPAPDKVLEAIKKYAAADQRTLFDLVMDAFVQPAYASCSRCRRAVKFVADHERRRVYGFCSGGGGVCGSWSY
jgi:hypothetical protein